MSARTPCRVEVKHAVPVALAERLLAWSAAFLPPDRGVAGQQRVTSLYLDSPELTFFRWHRERRPHRFKLRVRRYGERAPDVVFAEIKERSGAVGRKSRAEVPAAALRAILSHDCVAPLANADPALHDFIGRRRAFCASPVMFVSCLRESLRDGRTGAELAVTVDRDIVFQPAPADRAEPDAAAWTSVPLPPRRGAAAAIVEVKYTGQPPAWMAVMLRHTAPDRTSFSKYAAAVRQHTSWSGL